MDSPHFPRGLSNKPDFVPLHPTQPLSINPLRSVPVLIDNETGKPVPMPFLLMCKHIYRDLKHLPWSSPNDFLPAFRLCLHKWKLAIFHSPSFSSVKNVLGLIFVIVPSLIRFINQRLEMFFGPTLGFLFSPNSHLSFQNGYGKHALTRAVSVLEEYVSDNLQYKTQIQRPYQLQPHPSTEYLAPNINSQQPHPQKTSHRQFYYPDAHTQQPNSYSFYEPIHPHQNQNQHFSNPNSFQPNYINSHPPYSTNTHPSHLIRSKSFSSKSNSSRNNQKSFHNPNREYIDTFSSSEDESTSSGPGSFETASVSSSTSYSSGFKDPSIYASSSKPTHVRKSRRRI